MKGTHPYSTDSGYANPTPYPTQSATTLLSNKDVERERDRERGREMYKERVKSFAEGSPERSHTQQYLPGSAPLGGQSRTPSSSSGQYVPTSAYFRQNSGEISGHNLSPGMGMGSGETRVKKSLSDGPVPFLPLSSSFSSSFSPFVASPTRNIDTSGTFNHSAFDGPRRSFEKDRQDSTYSTYSDQDVKLLPRFPFRIGSRSRTSSPTAGATIGIGSKKEKEENAYGVHMDESLSPTQEAHWDPIQGSFRLRSRRGSFADGLHTGSAVIQGGKSSTDIRNSSSSSNSTDESCGLYASNGLEARYDLQSVCVCVCVRV